MSLAERERENDALGRLLLERGVLSINQFLEAQSLAVQWNTNIIEVLLSQRWIKSSLLYGEIAKYYGLALVDFESDPPDMDLIRRYNSFDLCHLQFLPVRTRDGKLQVATSRPGSRNLLQVLDTFGPQTEVVVAQPHQITWALQQAFRQEHLHSAIFGLAELDPEMSAQRVITSPQVLFLYALGSAAFGGFAFAPIATLIVINAALTIFYLGNFLFKASLVWKGGEGRSTNALSIATEARLLRDEDLPVFTILVPMFREPEVLPILANALRTLDYPLAKLDIKLVLEEEDQETIDAAIDLGLEGIFEILRVPLSHPQTKPKACNYALNFARGDFLVVYDAEDKPEADQLRKVIAAFRQMPPETACVQCRLNYFNVRENWLTRMFTLDYSLWFDLMLPGLDRLRIPVPLGGTSNHFRMNVLKELKAWDPFNVTEDADLGVRLTQKGYRVGVIDSTTFEEANVSIPNWVRQRSRWVKGYMQTFLVHTRRPLHMIQAVGPMRTLGLFIFIGGTFLSGLINPIFWLTFSIWLALGLNTGSQFLPPIILHMSLINLLLGNGVLIYLTMIAPFRRGWSDLALWGASVPVYWILMTVASYKGLYQLVRNPFYWEKTQHGLSKENATEAGEVQISGNGPEFL